MLCWTKTVLTLLQTGQSLRGNGSAKLYPFVSLLMSTCCNLLSKLHIMMHLITLCFLLMHGTPSNNEILCIAWMETHKILQFVVVLGVLGVLHFLLDLMDKSINLQPGVTASHQLILLATSLKVTSTGLLSWCTSCIYQCIHPWTRPPYFLLTRQPSI